MGMTVLGNRNAQRQAHEPVEGLPVYDEPIRSPQDFVIPAGSGGMVLHPINPEASYNFVSLPFGPAAVLAVGTNVQMTFDPLATTNAGMALLVAGDPACAALLTVIVPGLLENIPAALGGTGGNLWSDLIAVPGAMFRRDPTTGRFVPWDGAIGGGPAMLAALVAIQANTAPDNRSGGVTHSLDNGGAAFVDHSLGIAGRTLSVDGLTGTASIRLVVGGVPYPTLPAPARDIFPLDRWFHDFTDVLLSCVSQPGQTITLYAGWRV